MKNIIKIITLLLLSTNFCTSQNFIGTWYNNSNPCDSLVITKNESKFKAEYLNSNFSANINEGFLEIYASETIKVSSLKESELLINKVTYSKKISNDVFSLNGEWKIFECEKKYEYGASIEIKENEIIIPFGSPVTIYGKLERISLDTFSVKFDYTDATPSFYQVAGSLENIDVEKPIAFIIFKSKNHINLVWKGISIKGLDKKWLDNLSDDGYWGENAVNNDNIITYIRE